MSKRFTIVENIKNNKHMREMKVYTGGGDVILDLNVVNEKGMKSLPGSGKSLFKGPGVRGSMVSTRHWKKDSMSGAEWASRLMAREKAST